MDDWNRNDEWEVRRTFHELATIAVLAQTRPDKVDDVVTRVERNVDKAKQGQITQEEFDRVVEMIIALHAQEKTTLAEQVAVTAINELYGLGYEYDKTFDQRIKAVTLDDVVRVANKYLGKHIVVTASRLPGDAFKE